MSKGKSPSVFERCRNKAEADYKTLTKSAFRNKILQHRFQEMPHDPEKPNETMHMGRRSQSSAAKLAWLL